MVRSYKNCYLEPADSFEKWKEPRTQRAEMSETSRSDPKCPPYPTVPHSHTAHLAFASFCISHNTKALYLHLFSRCGAGFRPFVVASHLLILGFRLYCIGFRGSIFQRGFHLCVPTWFNFALFMGIHDMQVRLCRPNQG